ncbi:MAG: hypothetical protein A2X43_11655 [Candidatus Margulisbacteria bacterium GWD2_39_127]|nr:MAG: hypothetical protein A2X43_11655 [Candidatus Margulisbacteria bacterium GWD2_39_127]
MKIYQKEIETYLKDSNAFGNIYFSRYFEWQGVIRESFFIESVTNNMLSLGLILITKKAENNYIKELFPFAKIKGTLNTANIKNCSLEIIINFYNEDQLIASGRQTIVFADTKRQITKIPDNIKKKLKEYLSE